MLLIILLTLSAVSCLPVRESLCHPDDEFTCKNGMCISAEWRCDNVPDCLNGEDETDCHYLHDCPKDSFMCKTGECLPKEVKCDGQQNCSDGSDERGCEQRAPLLRVTHSLPTPSLCHPDDEFACHNGTCIPAEWACDNVPDCLNGEDEANCHYLHHCSKGSFMCKTGECMPEDVKCNGQLNCPDGSDEHGCKQIAPLLIVTPSPLPAPVPIPLPATVPAPLPAPVPALSLCHPDDEFACHNGTCIPAEWACDNVHDCLNGEDEANCHYLHVCPKNLFMCKTGDCLPKEVKCDGQLNCPDGSDERGCQPKAPLLRVTHSSSPSLCHSDNEFACTDGTCISAEWLCDNVPDCLNKDDETECAYLHNCPKDTFMCRSGECMPKEVKCDGQRNCLDGSDERGCLSNSTMESTTKNASIMDGANTTFWIYIILIVLALTLMSLIGLSVKYWFFTPRRCPADETKVQFLVVEDDGRCTAY